MRSAVVLITGFAAEREVDAFVRAEIRYFRSRVMTLGRCEGPSLKLVVEDEVKPGAEEQAAKIARRYPRLTVEILVREDGRRSHRRFVDGHEDRREPNGTRLDRLGRHERTLPVLEEIYETF